MEKLSAGTFDQSIAARDLGKKSKYAIILYNPAERKGAKEEADMLMEGLKYVDFDVIVDTWIHAAELLEKISNLLILLVNKSSQIFISVMSHGHHGILRGVDNSEISVNAVLELSAERIPQHIPVVCKNNINSVAL